MEKQNILNKIKNKFIELLMKPQKVSFLKFFFYITMYTLIVFNSEFITRFWSIPEVSDNIFITLTIPFVLISVIILFYVIMTPPVIGKYIIAISFITSAIVLYMIKFYGIGMDYDMVVNFAKTDTAEADSYFNLYSFLFVTLIGAIPAIIIARVKFKPMKWYNHILHRLYLIIIALGILFSCGSFLYKEYTFILRNNHHLYVKMVPVYLGNVYKYVRDTYFSDPLPYRVQGLDAKLIPAKNDKPNLFVFVIGETARAKNFSHYGYERETNKYTQKQDVIVPKNVSSCATSTAKSLPCMLSSLKRTDYSYSIADSQDNVLDILYRAGASVLWIDNNSSDYNVAKKERVKKKFTDSDNAKYCKDKVCYDMLLLNNFDDEISALEKDNKFVVFHTIGSHGPKYYQRYPKEFEVFKPACNNPEVSRCDNKHLINTYDNSILYTDFVLSEIIEKLKTYQDKYNVAMLYVSDHGESLGENGIYLHGIPYSIALKVQTKIPLIMWVPDQYADANGIDKKCLLKNANDKSNEYSHDNIFHSLLGAYGVSTKIRNDRLDIFAGCKK
ncbi:MAG: phosphoethanolamine transferase [Alphaproteobacteria bacterium]